MSKKKQPERNGLEWEHIFQAIGHPTLILDPKHTIITANDAAADATGMPRGELIGKKCYDVFHTSDQPPVCCPMEAMKRSDRMETEAMEMEALGGIYLVSCTPVFNEQDNLDKIIHIATDITKRKRAEAELRESEKKYKELFNTALVGITVHDSKGYITAANDTAERIFGIAEAELMEKDLDFWKGKLLNPDGTPMDISELPLSIVAKTKAPSEGNLVGLQMPEKENPRWFLHSARPIVNNEKTIEKVVTSFVDITERWDMQKALHESKQFLQDVFDGIQDGISVLDPELTIIRVNEWIKKRHHNELPMTGKKCYRVYQRRDSPCPWCPSMKALSTGEAQVGEVRVPQEEESFWWSRISAYPLKNEKGEVTGVIEHVKDITDWKKAEEKIKHLNEVLKSIRNFNQLIVKENDRDKLIKGTCDNLTETRGYNAAWIALLDENNRLITSAQAGIGTDFEPLKKQLKKGMLNECGKRALKQSEVVVIEDTEPDCEDCPLLGKEPGGSAMIIRLEHEEKVYGLLSVSIPKELAFDTEEQGLFQDVAEDIAYALHGIEVQQQRERTKKKLEEREDRLSKIMIAANDGMWDWDLTTDEVYYDPRYYEMAGYHVDEFPHRLNEFQKRVHPDEIDYVMDQAQKHLAGDIERFIVEFRFKKKAGGWMWIMGRGKIVEKDEDGTPLRFVGTHTDITARKKAEEQYRCVVENAHDAIYLIHPERGFQYVNPAFEELVGYNADEIHSDTFSFWDIIHPDDIAMIEERGVARARGEEVPDRYEFRIIAKGGMVKTVEAITVDVAAEDILVMGILRDVTERRKAEQERERAMAEVERALELEKRFKADAAHFFLNPIAICKGYMELAMERMPDDCCEQMKSSRDAIKRVEAVIKNIVEKGEIHE